MSRAPKSVESTPTTTLRDERARAAAFSRLTPQAAPVIVTLVKAVGGRLACLLHRWRVLDAQGAWRLATAHEVATLVRPLIASVYGSERHELASLVASISRQTTPNAASLAAVLAIDDILKVVGDYSIVLVHDRNGGALPRYLPRELDRALIDRVRKAGGTIESFKGGERVPVDLDVGGGAA